MKQVVAEPKIAFRIFESDFEFGPRTVEKARSVDVSLNQERRGYDNSKSNQIASLLSVYESQQSS